MSQFKEPKTDASPQNPRIRGLRVAYQEPSKLENHCEADDVVLVQVTTIGTTLEQIKEKAENLLDQEFLTKEINFKELTDVKILEPDEVRVWRIVEKFHFLSYFAVQNVMFPSK